jgi:hypothetical protein
MWRRVAVVLRSSETSVNTTAFFKWLLSLADGIERQNLNYFLENSSHKAWNPNPLADSSFTQTAVSCDNILRLGGRCGSMDDVGNSEN